MRANAPSLLQDDGFDDDFFVSKYDAMRNEVNDVSCYLIP
jgi:hypothetical protein